MLFLILLLIVGVVNYGQSAPLIYQPQPLQAQQQPFLPSQQTFQYQQQPFQYQQQSTPMMIPFKFVYPGNQHQIIQMPYQINQLGQLTPANEAYLRQSGLLGMIPGLPLEVNVVDVINAVIKFFQSINIPFIGGLFGPQPLAGQLGGMPAIPAIQDPMIAIGQNTRIGNNVQVVPFPIVIMVPQQKTNQLDETDTKSAV